MEMGEEYSEEYVVVVDDEVFSRVKAELRASKAEFKSIAYVEGLSCAQGKILAAENTIVFTGLNDRFTKGEINHFHIYENGHTKFKKEKLLDLYLRDFQMHQIPDESAIYIAIPFIAPCTDDLIHAEIHLNAKDLGNIIKSENEASRQDRLKAMIFLRHHLHEGLISEYIGVKDSTILWKNLEERYDHQKSIILPKARYDWMHPRL
ncbi:hypothetical protein L3X38_036534 [Prunus dulcis]|uniref:Uncharacterized protein n=1 Tax=Prunus dulcis TaxID=3755 RepID=A0AAD4V3E6_PRUDU|nr:hypothetical protein L3X38_036534 [Prunus dulcis]